MALGARDLAAVRRTAVRPAGGGCRARPDRGAYALALPLDDPGFDASVLCEFRARLVAGGAEPLLFDAVLDLARARHLVGAGGRQRTDATHVLAAVRGLNRLTCVTETMRHALGSLAVAAPGWLAAHARPHWAERCEHRGPAERMPRSATRRAALAVAIGVDGHDLLAAAFSADAPPWLRQLPAVETLRRVWVQQFYLADGTVRWREREGIPPASLFISSPYDLDAHDARKGTTSWTGYKVHLTETCDDDRPRVVTHVQTTVAPVADGAATTPAHEALERKGLLPAEHLVDTGHLDAGLLVETRRRFATDLIGPVRRDLRWQEGRGRLRGRGLRGRLGKAARHLPAGGPQRQLDSGGRQPRGARHQGEVLPARLRRLRGSRSLRRPERRPPADDAAPSERVRGAC